MALSFPPPPRAFDRQLIFSFQKEANHPRRLSWRIQYPNVGAMGKVQMPYPWDSVKIILYSNVVVFSWALIERGKSIFYLVNSLLEFDFDCYSWSQLHGMVLLGAHHLKPVTTPYSCHGVFTDWSIFSLNLSGIQIPTGTPVTNCNHKHGLTLTCRHHVGIFSWDLIVLCSPKRAYVDWNWPISRVKYLKRHLTFCFQEMANDKPLGSWRIQLKIPMMGAWEKYKCSAMG